MADYTILDFDTLYDHWLTPPFRRKCVASTFRVTDIILDLSVYLDAVILSSWRWRQHVHPKRCCPLTVLHGVKTCYESVKHTNLGISVLLIET
jgi:hypothetical protein